MAHIEPEKRFFDMADTVDKHRVAVYESGHLKYTLQYSKQKLLSYKLEVNLIQEENGPNLGTVFFADNFFSKNDVPIKVNGTSLGSLETTLIRDGHFTNRHYFELPSNTNDRQKFTWKKSKTAKKGLDLIGPNDEVCATFTPIKSSPRAGRIEISTALGLVLERATVLSCVGMLAKKARDDGQSKMFAGGVSLGVEAGITAATAT